VNDASNTLAHGIDELSALQRRVAELERRLSEALTAKEALPEKESYFRRIVENIGDVIFEVDHQGMVIYLSTVGKDIWGYDQKDIIGTNFIDLVHRDDRDLLIQRFLELGAGVEYPLIYRLKNKAGEYRWVRTRTKPNIENGVFISAIGTLIDVTDQKQTEEALRKSEIKYRQIFESFEDIYYQTNIEGYIEIVSPSVFNIAGYRPDELIGKSVLEIYAFPADREKMISALLAHSHVRDIEMMLKDKQGALKPASVSAHFIHDEQGVPEGIFGTVRDISERKRAEEALTEREAKFRTLFESANDAILLMDQDIFIDCNPKTLKMFGCTREEIIGQPPYRFSPEFQPDGRNSSEEALEKIKAAFDGQAQFFEWRHSRRDGTLFDAEVSLNAFSTACKSYVQAIVRDVTTRKQVEEAIQESEKKFKRLADNMHDMILEVDLEGTRTYVSPSHKTGLGIEVSEMLQQPIYDRIHPEDLQPTLEAFAHGVKTKSPQLVAYRFLNGKGKYRWLESYGTPIHDSEQVLIGGVIVSRDITEKKLAEEKLNSQMSFIETLIDTIPSPVFYKDSSERYLGCNRAFEKLFGVSRESIIGKTTYDIAPAEYAAKYSAKDRELFENHGSQTYEGKVADPNGSIRDVIISKATYTNARKKITGLVGVLMDITDNKQVEAKLSNTLNSLRKAFRTVIQVMVAAVESRDPYTAGHQNRSADLAGAIATEMGLSKDKIDGIRMAGSIHDIGKLSIPAEILAKPTRLSEIELHLVRQHAQRGYEMLKEVESPWPLAEIVYQHHERMDGSGYPRNLKGEEILIEARILAVADVVESMASHRPYRPGLGLDEALKEIEANRETLYDADTVDACLKLFKEKGYQL